AFFYPDYYLSTYPLYLAAVMGLVAAFVAKREPGRAERFFATFGRTSLFTYVTQYFVMQTIPLVAGWRQRMSPLALGAYFAAGLLALYGISWLYEALLPRRRPLRPATASAAARAEAAASGP